jgi:hypothetical protein
MFGPMGTIFRPALNRLPIYMLAMIDATPKGKNNYSA